MLGQFTVSFCSSVENHCKNTTNTQKHTKLTQKTRKQYENNMISQPSARCKKHKTPETHKNTKNTHKNTKTNTCLKTHAHKHKKNTKEKTIPILKNRTQFSNTHWVRQLSRASARNRRWVWRAAATGPDAGILSPAVGAWPGRLRSGVWAPGT